MQLPIHWPRFKRWRAPKGAAQESAGRKPWETMHTKSRPEGAEQPADENAHNIVHENPHADLMCGWRRTCFALTGLILFSCRSSQGLRPGLSCCTPAGCQL